MQDNILQLKDKVKLNFQDTLTLNEIKNNRLEKLSKMIEGMNHRLDEELGSKSQGDDNSDDKEEEFVQNEKSLPH